MSDFAKKLTRNAELHSYLNQLAELTGRDVTVEQLSSIEEVERLQSVATQLKAHPRKLIKIPPEALVQERYSSLIQKLAIASPGPVSVWLNATASCGTYFLSGIDEFNFSFRFSAIPEGIVVLLTEDGTDRLLLDFDSGGVVVELQGATWGNIEY